MRVPLGSANRKALLLGTALASTLLIASLVTPTPAAAVVTCVGDVGTGPLPIAHNEMEPIHCVNTEARTNNPGPAIFLYTNTNSGSYIYLNSQGTLISTNNLDATSLSVGSSAADSPIDIFNYGDIFATSTGANANGIDVFEGRPQWLGRPPKHR